jgi:hypothetical protein
MPEPDKTTSGYGYPLTMSRLNQTTQVGPVLSDQSLRTEQMKQIENKIPTEEDWQGYQDDLDARFAYQLFLEKTLWRCNLYFR